MEHEVIPAKKKDEGQFELFLAISPPYWIDAQCSIPHHATMESDPYKEEQTWRRDAGKFIKALVRHWWKVLAAAAAADLLAVTQFMGMSDYIPSWLGGVIGGLGFAISCFHIFRAQEQTIDTLRAEIEVFKYAKAAEGDSKNIALTLLGVELYELQNRIKFLNSKWPYELRALGEELTYEGNRTSTELIKSIHSNISAFGTVELSLFTNTLDFNPNEVPTGTEDMQKKRLHMDTLA